MYGLVSISLLLNRLERTQLFGIWRSTRWRRVKRQARATKQEESIHGKHVRKVSQNCLKTFPVIFVTVLDIAFLQPWVKKPLFGQEILLLSSIRTHELTKMFKWTIREYCSILNGFFFMTLVIWVFSGCLTLVRKMLQIARSRVFLINFASWFSLSNAKVMILAT